MIFAIHRYQFCEQSPLAMTNDDRMLQRWITLLGVNFLDCSF